MRVLNTPDPRVYRVVQWTTGNVGKSSVAAIARNPTLELVGCYAWSPDKAGVDVGELAGDRRVKTGETVHFDKDLKPIAGGLFDEKLTGGHGGNKWSAIDLPEPLPNPVMEEPIRRLLGLTQKQYEGVLSGEHTLPMFGTGAAAIGKALDKIDLPKALAATREQVKLGRGANRDAAIRKLAYLKSADKMGLHPRDWMLDKVPVLPLGGGE